MIKKGCFTRKKMTLYTMGQMKITVIPAIKKETNINAPDDVKKIRIAAYCRVSTDNEEQESSYDV